MTFGRKGILQHTKMIEMWKDVSWLQAPFCGLPLTRHTQGTLYYVPMEFVTQQHNMLLCLDDPQIVFEYWQLLH
jgi:hypothetical protein